MVTSVNAPRANVQDAARTVYHLTGLTCADCAAQFEQKLKKYPGVKDARVNFGAARVTIIGDAPPIEIINELGAFDNIRVDETRNLASDHPGRSPWWTQPTAIFTVISGALIVAAFMLQTLAARSVIGTPESLIIGLYLLATVTGGWQTGKLGLRNLARMQFDMNTLMTVAVSGAVAIGYWEEAAVVAFLFGASETLEEYSIAKARQSLRSLLDLAPREARVVREGQERTLPVDEVQVGDLMLVRPGEKIAMDGIVEQGSSSINEAAITGESIPVHKERGDEVFAGSINGEGALLVKVTKLARDTTLAKIIELVEEAQEQRAASQVFVDRFARYYTPIVMAAAAVIAVVPPLVVESDWPTWIYRGLALLIVACPCALVISTPVAIVTAIGNAARNGVLIKGGVHLENLGSIKAMAFDKTGTLTEGRPEVTEIDVIPGANRAEEELLAILAGIEFQSEHPLATAIVTELKRRGIAPADVTGFQAIPGKGARAEHKGKTYFVGNDRLFTELGVDVTWWRAVSAQRHNEGKTIVLFGSDEGVLAVVALADSIRESTRWTISELKRAGITKTIMLTGDNAATARAVAAEAGIDEYRARLLPGDKVRAIKELREQHERVAMIGDGVNDAPALAVATVGIAMGGAGTDTAIETADIVLMADDLSKLPYAVRLSRRALSIIKQNIGFAIIIKAIAVLLSFPGWLTLWLAILSDTGATVLVILNSLRLLGVR